MPFSEQKLIRSLKKAGATEMQVKEIVSSIESQIFEGITTKKIYQLAFNQLRNQSRTVASRYQLKRAIMELGPSGFPFEKYVAKILELQGYKTQVGKIVKGQCVSHEIDVIAEKDDQHFMVECKYHNQTGTISDVKIPLYIQARFKDVEAAWKTIPGHDMKFHQGWLVTNTRFSSDAIQYGICVGLKLVGWNYPVNAGLNDIIDALGLYPVTALASLTRTEKQQLLKRQIVLCKEICHNESILATIGIKPDRIVKIIEEGNMLCHKLMKNGQH